METALSGMHHVLNSLLIAQCSICNILSILTSNKGSSDQFVRYHANKLEPLRVRLSRAVALKQSPPIVNYCTVPTCLNIVYSLKLC